MPPPLTNSPFYYSEEEDEDGNFVPVVPTQVRLGGDKDEDEDEDEDEEIDSYSKLTGVV
jgi:hypothetical protein